VNEIHDAIRGLDPLVEDDEQCFSVIYAEKCFTNLALVIDRLARDQNDKTLGLVFIDYKSLEVRQLGSIYEGLFDFKLKLASEDLATKTEKKKEECVLFAQVRHRGHRAAAECGPAFVIWRVVVRRSARRSSIMLWYTGRPWRKNAAGQYFKRLLMNCGRGSLKRETCEFAGKPPLLFA